MTVEPDDYSQDICPWGCIFYKGKLAGDCRIPESKSCALRQPKEEPKTEIDPTDFPWYGGLV